MNAPCGHYCPGCARRAADIDALTLEVRRLRGEMAALYRAVSEGRDISTLALDRANAGLAVLAAPYEGGARSSRSLRLLRGGAA